MAGKSASPADWLRGLFAKKKPEPSYPRLPLVNDRGESNIPGLYLAGEVAGTPLIKLGLNAGHELAERIHRELQGSDAAEGVLDLVIVGAGASGLGAAARARSLGLSYVVLESERFAMTVQNMHKGKVLFAEPAGVKLEGDLWFEECSREALLEKWRAQIDELGLDVREHEKVTDVQRRGELFDVETTRDRYRARRVLLAVGKAGNPRKAGAPGEDAHAERIFHHLADPDALRDQKILIYGGGDVACEAARALAPNNDVTMVTIDEEFVYPKKRNADAVRALAADGAIDLHMNTWLKGIEDGAVALEATGGERFTVQNDVVFEMIGAELPLPFFRKIGVKLEGTWDAKRWLALAVVFVAVYSLYALKSYGKGWSSFPFDRIIPAQSYYDALRSMFDVAFAPFAWLFSDAARADILRDAGYQQGFLYSGLYSVLMAVFGYQALVRWRGVARDKRYQTWRYVSLIGFQLSFFLGVNVVAVHAMSLKYAWRAWGLYQPYPLFFNTFFWWYDGDPRWVMWTFVIAGLLGTFVAIPIASRKHGKRFCTWVCGCGGLAETLGDRWRHLAAKGERSRLWEFQGVVVFAASVVVGLVVVGLYETDGNNGWWRAYNYIVDFWLVAVIPIALYPFFGGKVWCRYWCPLAAYNGLLARWYGLLRITSNDQCISCTQCSRYCQVGVDVMAFAKNQAPFDNANSSCIQCGICIDVCPMGVLEFDDSPRKSLPIVN
jgi:thioredoxin reductase/ferredoxin